MEGRVPPPLPSSSPPQGQFSAPPRMAPRPRYIPPMNHASLPRELRPSVNDDGRLTQWPVRQKVQRMATAYPATKFDTGREYRASAR